MQLGLAKGHLSPAAFASNQILKPERPKPHFPNCLSATAPTIITAASYSGIGGTIEELGCLSQNVPPKSIGGLVLEAVRLRHRQLPIADTVVRCDETEARELLSYAVFHCPKAVHTIRDAFTKAKLTP
jgi:hypothetical protein